MHFEGRPVDALFFETAPWQFKNIVDLDAPASKVFAIFEDGESWPHWFRAIHKVVWTSDKPYGVGTTRTVSLAAATIDEKFFIWEPDRRMAFYVTGSSAPLTHAMAEDYLLEEPTPGKTRFTYRVAMDPQLLISVPGPLSRIYFESMFESACKHLKTYVQR